MTTTTRAVIYLRVSLDHTGEGLAVDRQREDCLRIVGQRGWTLVGEYRDNSISASKRNVRRPQYDEMVAEHAAGEFDALVCWDLDRLTRQPRQLEDWIDAAQDHGLLLVTANGEADLSTDGGRMFARVKAAVARGEIERKGERQRRAGQQRAELGRVPKGPRLWGYTTAGQLIEDEAATVKAMFVDFYAGTSLREIARNLDAQQVPSRRGQPWHPSTVHGILSNARYCGRSSRYGAVLSGVAGQWTPIVDEGLFDEVNARLADPRRKTSKVGTARRHLGASLFLCGVCDSPVASHTGGRYRCPKGHLTRLGAPIEEAVSELICERLADPALAGKLVTAKTDPKLVAEISRLRGRLVKVEADYDADLIDGRRYHTATDKINAELTTALASLARASSAGAAVSTLTAPDRVSAFVNASLGARRAVVAFLLTVRLLPVPQGRRGFDPASVEISWHV